MLKKFIKYAVGWGIAALIDLTLLWWFTEYLWIYYLLSAVFAFVFSFLFGFYFQKVITFKSKSKSKKHILEWTYFLIFQLIWLALNLILLWFLSGILWFDYILVAIFNKIVIFIWNFLMNYFFNFNH
jgi:putative flippase GtrA